MEAYEMMRMIYMGGIVLGLVFILMACQKDPNPPEMSKDDSEPEAIETASEKDKKFVVALKDEEGIIRGTALLTQDKEEVHIDVEADHLREGQYGIHIHENGLCEA